DLALLADHLRELLGYLLAAEVVVGAYIGEREGVVAGLGVVAVAEEGIDGDDLCAFVIDFLERSLEGFGGSRRDKEQIELAPGDSRLEYRYLVLGAPGLGILGYDKLGARLIGRGLYALLH